MIITITGRSGSGKSLVAKILTDIGNAYYIDIDKIGHEIIEREEIKSQLQQEFDLHLTKEGKINRKELSQKVFSNKAQMKILEEITWTSMEREIDKQININQEKLIILDWIQITKTKYFKQSKLNILVEAPFEIRLKRGVERDKISKMKFLEREQAAPKLIEQDYDIVIMNTKGKTELQKQVKEIYEQSIISREF